MAEIKGELSNYYVSIEFDKNGKIWFKSGQATDKSSAQNIIKTKIAEGPARSLALNTPRGLSGQNTSAISIANIAKTLKSVNNEKYQTFDQRAWYGSGMDFNEFNPEKDPYRCRRYGTRPRKKWLRRIKNKSKARNYRHICTK